MNIKTLYVVPTSYCTFGSAEHPYTEKENRRLGIEAALALIEKYPDFRWTCSSSGAVADFCAKADELSLKMFRSAVIKGNIEVTGFNCAHSSFMSDMALMKSLEVLDDDKKRKFNVSLLMQQNVGGVNSGIVRRACEKGADYLWVSIDSSMAQMRKPLPFAFNWRVSVKEKVFVWADDFKEDLFSLIFAERSPEFNGFSDPAACYVLARAIKKADKKAMVEMSARLCTRLEETERRAEYSATAYPVRFTGGDGYNNPEAVAALPEFVEKWNSLGLVPELVLATASEALRHVEKEIKNTNLLSLTGEWTDGIGSAASMPREIKILRDTERKLRAALTLPAFNTQKETRFADGILSDLCVFGEITHRCDERLATPVDSAEYKRSRLFLASAKTDMLYADRVRNYFEQSDSGLIYVYNTGKSFYRGLVKVPVHCKNPAWYCAVNTKTAHTEKLSYRDGCACFYAEIPAGGIQTFKLSEEIGSDVSSIRIPAITVDGRGYPTEIVWGDIRLEESVLGEFCAVGTDSEKQRDVLDSLYTERETDKKNSLVRHYSVIYQSDFGNAVRREDDCFIRFEQPFYNDRIAYGRRELTIWKKAPRVTVKITLDRMPSDEPECFYIKFLLGNARANAVSSAGGKVFEVGRGMTDFASFDSLTLDGWVAYPYDDILFMSKDAPVMCFGGANYFTGKSSLDSDFGALFSCVFNNTYNKKHPRDFSGITEFTYDVLVGVKTDDFTADRMLFNTSYTEPVVYSEI